MCVERSDIPHSFYVIHLATKRPTRLVISLSIASIWNGAHDSMGGIVTRYYLSKYKPSNLGKVILIASPNQGSELVQKFQTTKWIANILGPGCLQIAKNSTLLTSIAKPYYKVGIISADLSINPITSLFFLAGPDDGTVTVESTLLEDMTDHVTISSTHTMVLKHHMTFEQIKHFLEHGSFQKKV